MDRRLASALAVAAIVVVLVVLRLLGVDLSGCNGDGQTGLAMPITINDDRIQDELQEQLTAASLSNGKLSLIVVLDEPPAPWSGSPGRFEVELRPNGDDVLRFNGRPIREDQFSEFRQQRIEERLNWREQRRASNRQRLTALARVELATAGSADPNGANDPIGGARLSNPEFGGDEAGRRPRFPGYSDDMRAAFEERRAWYRTQMTAAELDAFLKRHGTDLVVGIEEDHEEYPELNLGDALDALKIPASTPGIGFKGHRIGIYINEAKGRCPDGNIVPDPADKPDFDRELVKYENLAGGTADDHATQVGIILRRTAPWAALFCGPDILPEHPYDSVPPIWVANYSYGVGSGGAYLSRDREVDIAVAETGVAVFKSAGNRGMSRPAWVTSPGKGFNVVTVGGYDPAGSSGPVMGSSSSHEDPKTGATKPEVVAPGVSLQLNEGGFPALTGTSFAAPIVAGAAADLMQKHEWLQGSPAQLKALLMAGAVRDVDGTSGSLGALDGAGGIDWEHSAEQGFSDQWWGDNSSHFVNNELRTTRRFQKDRRYRVVLNWLVDGNYAYTNQGTNMDLSLQILRPDGSVLATSDMPKGALEFVEFVADRPGTATYTIVIRRERNDGGIVEVALHSRHVGS